MNREQRKQRWSLTLLYSGVFFAIELIAVLITTGLSFLLTRLGVLDSFGIPANSGLALLVVMLLISAVVGILITVFTMKIPLKPFNRLINNMNRLAGGDYSARLDYGKHLQKNPAFRELSDSFNAMAEELENTQMLRSDFVNNFSHEFKTPIVSIAGFAKLLRRGKLTEEQKQEYLAIIEEESLRLAAMATNVMSLTKIENQTILTDLTTFNLSEQLRGCVLLLEEKWSRKELDLDLEFPECTIRANEEMLKQVWINLLDNAIKFSPDSSGIELLLRKRPGGVLFTITDHGSGIPSEAQTHIFDKFYQGDTSHTVQGNGLGLTIAKKIIELHKGNIQIKKSDISGTIFEVMLPEV